MIQIRDFRQVEPQPEADGVNMYAVIGAEDGAPFFDMRVFEVEPGYATPRHTHWWEHEVFVLSGEGVIVTEQGEKRIGYGSVIWVPGDELHSLRNTGDQLLRFVCMVPQEWLGGVERRRDRSSAPGGTSQ